jgi:hypothetical protein
MLKNKYITVYCLGREIGRLQMDISSKKTYFLFNEDFLKDPKAPNSFPKTGFQLFIN